MPGWCRRGPPLSKSYYGHLKSLREYRRRHLEEANLDLKRENQRLVEKLCVVMRESKGRQKQMFSVAPSGGQIKALKGSLRAL